MTDVGGHELRYDFEFSWESTYARAARLIAATTRPGRVLDLGAGVGELGVAVERFGYSYVGGDVDPANVAEMRARERDAFALDLLDDRAVDAIFDELDGRPGDPIVAVTALDVIEHLPDPQAAITLIGEIIERIGSDPAPVLVVSIPNVAHYDLAAKLLLGRWDVTEVGLLDATHVALFDEHRLAAAFRGWEELGRNDVIIDSTEQRFPPGLPTFGDTTLRAHLRSLRDRAGATGSTYQFVRAYRRREPFGRWSTAPEAKVPFLSVLTRTLGDRSTLTDTLASLAAQSDPDFELHVLVKNDDPDVADRIRGDVADFEPGFAGRCIVHDLADGGRSKPLNLGLETAAGEYVAVLDDDDVVTSDWVAAFKRLARSSPGRVVRAGVVVQWVEPGERFELVPVSGFESMYPDELDLLDTIRSNRSPSCSFAVPMGLVRALGLRFDDSQRVCEDWKFQLDAVRLVGAASTPEVTSVYRRARHGGSAAAETERVWIEDHERVIDDLDREPTLLPPGSLRRIHQLYERIEQLEGELRGAADE